MKNYVITILENSKSSAAADRCIESALYCGLEVEKYSAITPHNTKIYEALHEQGISAEGFKEKYSRLDNCIAAFLSHYSLWKLSVDTKQEVTIFEHDAVVTNTIPEFINYRYCISFGKPSYGKFNIPSNIGVNSLVSKRYFPGAHAYRVKPSGAKKLIEQAKIAAKPTDVFLHLDTFPWLEEYYPWPVEARDTFTTIQKTEGCLAKHNYGERYEII